MIKLIFRLMLLMLAVSLTVILAACGQSEPDSNGDSAGNQGVGGSTPPDDDKLIIPESGGIGRVPVAFEEIKYHRPAVEPLKDKFVATEQMIKDNTLPFMDQLLGIFKLYEDYEDFLTMKSYAEIMLDKNSADHKFTGELEYLQSASSTLLALSDRVKTAAAASPLAARFDDEFFDGELSVLYSGGLMVEVGVSELFEAERTLIADYESLSPDTVYITYGDETDTYRNIIRSLEEKYGISSVAYKNAMDSCRALYESEVRRTSINILVELIKVRKRISYSFGYSNYIEYVWETRGIDYTPGEAEKLLEDISDYVVPVYTNLAGRVFNSNNKKPTVAHDKTRILNSLGRAWGRLDGYISDVYAYMLSCGMYDVDTAHKGRNGGAFTTYLSSFESPFMFVTLEGNLEDYSTLSYQFGRYLDMTLNNGEHISGDMSEICAVGLELLTLTELEAELDTSTYSNLFYKQLESVLLTLIYQGFYAKFEHLVYSLPYQEINDVTLDEVVRKAADFMSLNSNVLSDSSAVLNSAVISNPFHAQAACTSAAVALDIFFAELEEDGSGVEIFTKLVNHKGNDLDLLSYLDLVNARSPFDDGVIKSIADNVHYVILGSHHFDKGEDNNTAGVFLIPPTPAIGIARSKAA